MRLIPYVRKVVPKENLLIINYEKLVQDPEGVVKKMCIFIEEEFEPRMLDINSHNSSAKPNQTGIFNSSVGQWRHMQHNEDAYLGQLINKKEMKQLGYSVEHIDVNMLKVANMFVTLPYAVWRALNANKYSRGPLFPYLVRRIYSLVNKE